jgi:DNA-binding MarR family transcriptional regulator
MAHLLRVAIMKKGKNMYKQSNHVAAEIAELTFKLLSNCQEKEERLAQQFGITVPEFRTLRVFHTDRKLHVKELVERVHLSGSRLSRILESLEEHGFLTRSIDFDDRRSIVITLTKKGSTMVKDLEERYVQIHEEILEGIPEELHEPLTQGLNKMLTSLEQWLKES